MYEQKLFYKNSEKLAEFCNQNYDNIYQWWQNEDRQDLIKKFLKNFASKDDSKVKNLYEIIEKNIKLITCNLFMSKIFEIYSDKLFSQIQILKDEFKILIKDINGREMVT